MTAKDESGNTVTTKPSAHNVGAWLFHLVEVNATLRLL